MIFNISEITDKYILFLKKYNLILNINYKNNYLSTLLSEIESLYQEYSNIDINYENVIINNKINLIENTLNKENHNQLQSQYPKIINIILSIYYDNKNYFDKIVNNSFQDEEKKKEFIFWCKNINSHNKVEFIEWMNFNGTRTLSFINYFIKQNPSLCSIIHSEDLYSSFVSLDIQEDIEKYFNCYHKFLYNNKDILIESIFITDNKSLNKKFIISIFTRAIIWLRINNKNKIKFKCWLSDIKKILPDKKYNNIGPKQVNTGATYRGSYDKITIWRKEEVKKVLIHEMGHSLEIEFSPPFDNNNQEKEYQTLLEHLITIFNIPENTEIRIYEAYNETWALIINTMFSTIEYKNKIKTNINLNDIFNYFLKLEISFSLFQCAKVLNFFNFKDFNHFFSLNGFNGSERKKSQYNQSSSILSYYIIKSSLLLNIDKFIEFCRDNNEDKFCVKFNNNSLTDFQKLIDICLMDKRYIEEINNILIKINKIKKIKKEEIYHSLRMSILDI